MKQLIELTKQLIAIPSSADNPQAQKEAIDFVANIVSSHAGITVERFEKNGRHSFLAYAGSTRPAKFDILLNAHVDVVHGAPEQFEPYEKDGKLYGRGALDMKGTTIVLTDVFCKLASSVDYNLGLQIVSDEEVGGFDGALFQLEEGVRADFVITGEYANSRATIYNAARGVFWAEILFKGRAAHGGHLWNGSNAVLKAAAFAEAVLRRYPTPNKETWTTTANIAHLSTPNQTFNKVPDTATLKIDFRFTQEDKTFDTRESFEAFMKAIDPAAELVDVPVMAPAIYVPILNHYLQGLSAATYHITGEKPHFKGRPAASDGRHFTIYGGSAIEFGLYGQHSHSNDEYVELSSFREYHDIMEAFLRQPLPAQLDQVVTGESEQALIQL